MMTSGRPPIIAINGDNPATVQVGSTYADLGATITGPTADLNLGIHTFVDGIATDPVVIDTSIPNTHIIEYVVSDSARLTSTTTAPSSSQPQQTITSLRRPPHQQPTTTHRSLPFPPQSLWAKLIEVMPQAKRARLLRTLGDVKSASAWRAVWSQAANAGRV